MFNDNPAVLNANKETHETDENPSILEEFYWLR